MATEAVSETSETTAHMSSLCSHLWYLLLSHLTFEDAMTLRCAAKSPKLEMEKLWRREGTLVPRCIRFLKPPSSLRSMAVSGLSATTLLDVTMVINSAESWSRLMTWIPISVSRLRLRFEAASSESTPDFVIGARWNYPEQSVSEIPLQSVNGNRELSFLSEIHLHSKKPLSPLLRRPMSQLLHRCKRLDCLRLEGVGVGTTLFARNLFACRTRIREVTLSETRADVALCGISGKVVHCVLRGLSDLELLRLRGCWRLDEVMFEVHRFFKQVSQIEDSSTFRCTYPPTRSLLLQLELWCD